MLQDRVIGRDAGRLLVSAEDELDGAVRGPRLGDGRHHQSPSAGVELLVAEEGDRPAGQPVQAAGRRRVLPQHLQTGARTDDPQSGARLGRQLGGGRLRPAQLHRLGQQLTEPAGAVVERQARVDRSAQHRAPLEVGDWRLVQRGHRVGHLAGGDVEPRHGAGEQAVVQYQPQLQPEETRRMPCREVESHLPDIHTECAVGRVTVSVCRAAWLLC